MHPKIRLFEGISAWMGQRVIGSLIVGMTCLGPLQPAYAYEPSTVAAGLLKIGSLVNAMSDGPDLALMYAAENSALLGSGPIN